MFTTFNVWALLGAATLKFIIGMIWYSPKVFGRLWIDAKGIKESDLSQGGIGYLIGTFMNSLLVAFGISVFLFLTKTHTLVDGLIVGFFAWLGFFLTCALSSLIWEKTPISAFLIEIGFGLVSYLVLGAFLSFF